MLNLDEQNALREQYREANPGWKPATEVYAGLARSALVENSRLLDLGCGRGGLVEQLQHPLSLTVGADPDMASLVEHRLALENPPFPRVAAFIERLPFQCGAFDVVIASWVLEHLPDPDRAFAEISRSLKPGGAFIFITPNRLHPLVYLNRIAGRLSLLQNALVERLYGREGGDTFPAYYRANTQNDLEKHAENSHMQLTYIETVPDPSYLALTPGLFGTANRMNSSLDERRHIHLVGMMEKL